MAHRYPKNILTMIAFLKKLPGVGTKTAERFTFELLKWNESDLKNFGNLLESILDSIKKCPLCGCLTENDKCQYCDLSQREKNTLCIIASPKDLYLIEETNSYTGLYHVIDHLISPMDGFNIDDKMILKLENRIEKLKVKEVIIALDSTLEGDATSLFIKTKLKKFDLNISRLAFGMPVGSSLEYIDGGTLAKAFIGRQKF
jgi:recombination protein RecR